jgi:hypothetical protein
MPVIEMAGRMITYWRTDHLTVYMKYGFDGLYLQQQNGIGSFDLAFRAIALSALCPDAVDATKSMSNRMKALSVTASYAVSTNSKYVYSLKYL